jgi:hypothetical protein
VRGIGKERVILDAGFQGRVLTMPQDGVQVTFEHLTMTNGVASEGGAVALTQKSTLVLRDVWLTGNKATVRGGGAISASAGRLELVRVRITGNGAQAAPAVDLSGSASARFLATLIAENNVQATIDGPVRLSDNASLEFVSSTVAYNSGSGIVMQPRGAGQAHLRVDSSVVMGTPDAIAVGRGQAPQVGVSRSVLHGGIGWVATDLLTQRTIPGFNLRDVERFRPSTGSAAIALGACRGGEAGIDLAGGRRAKVCTAGALEAAPSHIAATLLERAKAAKAKANESPW